MSEMNDGISEILTHEVTSALASREAGHFFTNTYINVRQITGCVLSNIIHKNYKY